MVTNGDVLTTMPFCELINFHREQKAMATIAVHQRQVKIDLGVIQWNGGPQINGYIEKPVYDYIVSMGIYVFEPRVLSYIPYGQYLDFPDLVKILIKAGEVVVGFCFDGYWQDLGNSEDYENAAKDFSEMSSRFIPEER